MSTLDNTRLSARAEALLAQGFRPLLSDVRPLSEWEARLILEEDADKTREDIRGGGSSPIYCFSAPGWAILASARAEKCWKPTGTSNSCRCCSATSRSARSTLPLSNCCPNPASVGATPAKRSGHSPLTVTSRACTQPIRRCSQRCALAGLHSPGGRACAPAAASVAASPAWTTAASNSSKEPVTCAAKQSGNRLTVRPCRRQMKRRTWVPFGLTRA